MSSNDIGRRIFLQTGVATLLFERVDLFDGGEQAQMSSGRVVDLAGNGVDGADVYAVDGSVTDEQFQRSFDGYQEDEDRTGVSLSVTRTESGGRFQFASDDLPSNPVYLARWSDDEKRTWFSRATARPTPLQLTHELLFDPKTAIVDTWTGASESYDMYGGCVSAWRRVDPDDPTNQTFVVEITQAMFGLVSGPFSGPFTIAPWEIALDRGEGRYNDWELNTQPLFPGQAVFSLTVPEAIGDEDVEVDYENVRVGEIASKLLGQNAGLDRERLTRWHPTRTPRLPASVSADVVAAYSTVPPEVAVKRMRQQGQIAALIGSGLSLVAGSLPFIGGPVSFAGDLHSFLDSADSPDDVSVAARLGDTISKGERPSPNTHDIVEQRYWMEPTVPTASVVYEVPVQFPETGDSGEFIAEVAWNAVDNNPASTAPNYLCTFSKRFSTEPRPHSSSGGTTGTADILSFEKGSVGDPKPADPWYLMGTAGTHEITSSYASDGSQSLHLASYRDDLARTEVAIDIDFSDVATVVYDGYVESNNANWGDIKVSLDSGGPPGTTISRKLVGGYPPEDQWYRDVSDGDVSDVSGVRPLVFWVRGDGNDAYFDNVRFLDESGSQLSATVVLPD